MDIQSLGVRLAKAANAEEESHRKGTKTGSKATHQREIRAIIEDIRGLLARIEDAVPFINLAITTSGANLSTTLPPTVSPSRLLQASTFLTAGDTQFSMAPNAPVQVGPTFTLSLYMLFTGHAYRGYGDSEHIRETTWKEVIHKANVKLMRIPLSMAYDKADQVSDVVESTGRGSGVSDNLNEPILHGEGKANEYAYRFEIVEDFDDDRVHSFEDYQTQPGPYGDVKLAGIRELVPIYQISKIFYADTGKILNIGSQGETNNPVLLLKRDINAVPPRKPMPMGQDIWSLDGGEDNEDNEDSETGDQRSEGEQSTGTEEDSQDDPNEQIRRESSVLLLEDPASNVLPAPDTPWKFPPDLDPEWLAFEVYTESEDSDSETSDVASQGTQEEPPENAPVNSTPSSSRLENDLSKLNISSPSPFSQHHPGSSTVAASSSQMSLSTPPITNQASVAFGGPIRTSLSLLEMLIRLTSLQQFQQVSHLAIPDELLTFFLEESSTTGAGGDTEERRRTRLAARRKVGFDPYDESPVKRRGEEYQYSSRDGADGEGDGRYTRENTPFGVESPRFSRERSNTPQGTPEPRLPRRSMSYNPASSPRRASAPLSPGLASSPLPSARAPRRATRPLDRVASDAHASEKMKSPLGKGINVETDSTLGTSPGYE